MKKYYLWFRTFQFGPLPFSIALAFILGTVLWGTMGLEKPVEFSSSEASERSIASVPSPWDMISQENKQKSLPGPEEMALDCSKENHRPPFVSKSPFIRLELTGCEIKQVSNHRNDYVATIFPLSKMKSTTDFISLAEGSNQIDVEAYSETGPIQMKLEVIYQ